MNGILRAIPGFTDPRPPVAPWEWLAVAAATLVGVFLRFWALDSIPPGLWYDEAIYGLDGLDVLRGVNRPIFFDTYGHMREPLYMYLLALGLALGPVEAWTIRAVSAVIGSATIPVTWWMARELAGPRVAAWTLLIIAPMRWHVHFSRTAFRVILSPLFAAITVALLARMVRRPTIAAGILLGVALGASLYTYLSMRLFVFVVLGALALACWTFRERRTQLLKSTAAALAAAFVIFAPLGIDFLRHPDHFTGRAGEVSLFDEGRGGWARIAVQARDVALMTTLRGDHEPKHSIPGWPTFLQSYAISNNPQAGGAAWEDARRIDPSAVPDVHGTGAPVFDLATGVLLMLALAMCIVRGARGCWPSGILALWILLGSLASVLSFGAPNMLRTLFLTPAVACVVGLGLSAIQNDLATRSNRTMANAGVLLFLVWFSAGETKRYFIDWPTSPRVAESFNANLVEISQWIREHPDRPDVVVLPRYLLDTPTIRFELDRVTGLTKDSEWEPDGREAWLIAPVAPYPPIQMDEDIANSAQILQRFQTPDGSDWAVLLEYTPEP